MKQNNVILRLKRDRKIINKMELTRLQRNFESCVREIDMLEKSKTSAATVYALIIAVIGTAFMAGATFAVTAQPPHISLCILFAIPGFIGWIHPYFIDGQSIGFYVKWTIKKRIMMLVSVAAIAGIAVIAVCLQSLLCVGTMSWIIRCPDIMDFIERRKLTLFRYGIIISPKGTGKWEGAG